MSMVSVHGPNTMYTTEGGGTPIASTPAGATATKSPSNGLVFNFAFTNPGARPAADFNWTFTGPGNPVAQASKTSGTVTFTGPGAVTIICTVSGATAPPPTNGAYTVSATATAGTPRLLEEGGDDPGTEGFDPGQHTVDEVKAHVEENPEDLDDVLTAEIAGKNRTTLVSHLEGLIPYDPADYTIDEVKAYVEAYAEETESVLESEVAGKNRSTLVKFLEGLLNEEVPEEPVEDPAE